MKKIGFNIFMCSCKIFYFGAVGWQEFPGNFKEYTLVKVMEVSIQTEEMLKGFDVSVYYSLY